MNSQTQDEALLRLLELKANELSPVEAIKTIHVVYGLTLAEAKRLFSLSPAWAAEAALGEQLQNEIIAALSDETTLR